HRAAVIRRGTVRKAPAVACAAFCPARCPAHCTIKLFSGLLDFALIGACEALVPATQTASFVKKRRDNDPRTKIPGPDFLRPGAAHRGDRGDPVLQPAL